MTEHVVCRRCGLRVRSTPSRHVRAHRCPHGHWCMVPYAQRRQGVRRQPCGECFEGRQLPLPFVRASA